MDLTAVLVGCGAMSRAWLEACRTVDGLRIVGLVDIAEDRARARAEEFGLADVVIGTSLPAVLKATNARAVFDVVVPAARRGVVFDALAHGCDVLCEKPLATSLDEARLIIDAAHRAGRIVAVVQNRRYLPSIRRIRRLLDAGTMGRVTSMHCDFFLAPHFGGFREEMDHVLLLDMAIHTFDASRAMTGLEAEYVYCHEWNPANSWFRHGASAAAIFEMSGGAVLTYRGSWCADGLPTSWEAKWRIVCERGTIVWDGSGDVTVEVIAAREREGHFSPVQPVSVPELDPSDTVGGHAGVIRDFLKAIDLRKTPETGAVHNFKSLAMVFGAIRSAETGQRVPVEQQDIAA